MVHRELTSVERNLRYRFKKLLTILLLFSITFVFSSCLSKTQQTSRPTKEGQPTSSVQSKEEIDAVFEVWVNEMLKLVNNVRRQNGVGELQLCSSLMKTAQSYATLMMKTNHYDHTGPDGSSPSDRALNNGYDWKNPPEQNPSGLLYQGIAENIAKGYPSVTSVMQGWINSPGHFKNLISPDAMHLGVGLAKNPNSSSEIYWVQNFGFGGTC